MTDKYPRIFLKAGRDASLLRGHPWVFSGAVAGAEGELSPGDVVVAVSHERQPLAVGFYNPTSDIAFRLLSADTKAVIDYAFWQKRIREAISLRGKVLPEGTTAYRLINAEGDWMPGLIVDRYAGYLALSIETAGMEKHRDAVVRILAEEMRPLGIYERSEGRARQLESLDEQVGVVYGEGPPQVIEITEDHLCFQVDIISGQKTGFFLDQRTNRKIAERLSNQTNVLNCFSYTGAFSVYCARGGALRVISVESSEAANEMARGNLERNGFSPEQHPVVKADVFKYLRETNELFDLIILDPPAFARAKKDVTKASRGYKDINLQAARVLKEGGILATFSCSNYIGEALFEKIVLGAMRDAGKSARLLQTMGPGPDHPVSLGHSEGHYLTGLLLNVTG
jgi:23S rRNA (cytosine1962-C5)-methyltransferase